MKKNKIGLFALAIGSVGFITCCSNGNTNGNLGGNTLAKDTTFLVSLNGSALSMDDAELKDIQNTFINSLRSTIGYDFKVETTYNAINTLKIRANSAYESVISSMPGVSKVAINQSYRFSEVYNGERTADEIQEGYIPLTNSAMSELSETVDDENQSAQSMMVPETSNGGAGSFVAILDTGFYLEHHAFQDFAPNTEARAKAEERFNYDDLTAVTNDLVASRDLSAVAGEEGSLYYNLKIPFYYDYGGSNLSATNGYDVYSQTSEHGNHVASITGANGTYEGIAPNCQLALMKVFYEEIPTDKTGVASSYAMDDDILEALNDCVTLGVDALNMSLGSDLDDFSDKSASMDVINKLYNNGVSVNIAAGNGGKDMFSPMYLYKDWATDQVDLGILGSYSNSDSATIVASSTNEKQYYEKAIQFGETVIGYDDQVDYTDGSDGISKDKERLFSSLVTSSTETLEAVLITDKGNTNHYGTSSDYTDMSNAVGDPNFFEGKVAIVDRGSNSFVDKANAAEEAGCSALIVINNDPTAIEFTFGMSWSSGESYDIPEIPVVFVLMRDRDSIINSLSAYQSGDSTYSNVQVGTFNVLEETVSTNPDKFKLSDFSSDGATTKLTMGPTITAPGSSIKGAILGEADSQGLVPKEDADPDKYGYLNGTSMATPNYCGAVALLIGEQEFASEEERREYIRSINMRTMSTAQIYSKEVTTYGSIDEEKAMTTPAANEEPEEVTIYVPNEDETTVETLPYSPRKQGAGVVDVTKALNSKVYIEGLDVKSDGTFAKDDNGNYVGINYGKVELKNNNLIANGIVNPGFRIYNETGLSGISYKVKMQLMAPQVTSYHNHDNELANYVGKDAQYEGAQVQTTGEQEIANVELGTITLNGEATQDFTNLKYELSAAQKDKLNSQFENGTYLEGYIHLEPVGVSSEDLETSGITELSFPFMGFYSDFAQADAVEPFTFEKKPDYDRVNGVTDGKLYGSDLVNYLAINSYGLSEANVESMIGATSFDYYQQNSKRGDILTNVDNIANFATLPVTQESDGTYTIYAGGKDTDVLYIQQFVYRSIDIATVQVIDNRGNVVASKYITDMITNGSGLFKSHVVSGYISSGILVHRAYAELPLYRENGGKLPNGTYTLKFTYNLLYGSTQTKQYNLVIDYDSPELTSKTIVEKNGQKVLRLKFNEIYLPSETRIHVNGDQTTFTLTKVSDGFVIDIVLDDAFLNGKLYVYIEDGAYNYGTYMINETAVNTGLFIRSDALTLGSNYTYTVTSNASSDQNINDTFEVNATDYAGKSLNLGTYSAYVTYDRKVNSSVVVYGVNADGSTTRIRDITLLNNTTLIVNTNYTKFIVVDSGLPNESISKEDNATVSVSTPTNGQVFVDKMSGIAGESIVIYAIPNSGYTVDTVTVNGKSATKDNNGNYQWILEQGENNVVVTFKTK